MSDSALCINCMRMIIRPRYGAKWKHGTELYNKTMIDCHNPIPVQEYIDGGIL